MTDPVITDAPRRVIEAANRLIDHISNYAPSVGEDDDEEVIVKLGELRELKRVLSILPSPSPSERREGAAGAMTFDMWWSRFLFEDAPPRTAAMAAWHAARSHGQPDPSNPFLSLPAPVPAPVSLGDQAIVGEKALMDVLAGRRPDQIAKGLADCGEGIPYESHSPGEAAYMAAYAVLRCCGLIRAGDQRVPQRIGRSVAQMIAPSPDQPSGGE